MQKLFDCPTIFGPFPDLLAIQTLRTGGFSAPPFDSLNLGLHTEDLPEKVARNRHYLFEKIGISENTLASSRQVHEDRILIAEEPGSYEGYDALVTNKRGLYLSVTIADCVPVLVFDTRNKVCAAIHAGWRGTKKTIVHQTLQLMDNRFGTRGSDCIAYIGTCIDGCDYEVGADVAGNFAGDFLQWNQAKNRYLLDLKKANYAQLTSFGIPEIRIEVSPFSTYSHPEKYFSHRHSGGRTGRMLAIIGLR